ncbi:MAG TPA: family 20 glycosylhydrolase [Chitinophagaceae bacterium]|nr:family 20 glycosylhydrolase [Chitinophagaceae bacterium]
MKAFPILFGACFILGTPNFLYAQPIHQDPLAVHIIPEPVKVTRLKGIFQLTRQVQIIIPWNNADARETALLFCRQVRASTGYWLRILHPGQPGEKGKSIRFILNQHADTTLNKEGYTLRVTPYHVFIRANQPAGLFYGMQSLVQLFPPELESTTRILGTRWIIPCVAILDYPRFGWRGLMLDVSRHFFPKSFVESYLNEMAKYKFNIFHWHLADDNGWRIQIKGLPQLTRIGAWRVPRSGRWGTFLPPQPGEAATYGGFYTQKDIREIVRYAQHRHITILPEIDVPGHSLSLIASYPNLSCTQLPYPVNPGSRFYQKQDNALCVGNDSTYLILDKIFTQVAALFPCKYIHVGGDECYKGFWAKCPKCQKLMADEHLQNVDELQSYFMKRMETMLLSKGKKMIGWDEILEGGLAPEATVMSWRGMEGGIAAAKMGHHVIMTPTKYCYLDLYQGDPAVEPPTYGVCLLSTCYRFEPVPDSVDARFILGGQGNLWTESVPNERQAEYMTWPRAMALAEVFWSPRDKRNWDDFVSRMETQFARLDQANIKYSTSAYDPIIAQDSSGNIQLSTEIDGLHIYYTFDDTDPDRFYPEYAGEPLQIPVGANMIKAVAYEGKKQVGREISFTIPASAPRPN